MSNMNTTRRDLAFLLPALGAVAAAQTKKGDAAKKAAPELATLKTFVTRFEDLPSRPNGPNISHPVFDGLTHGGFRVEMHETELGPGQSPHPPHRHSHEEAIMLWEGSLDYTINGKTTHLDPGGFGFSASNDEHGVKNPSTTAKAKYFVIAFGPST